MRFRPANISLINRRHYLPRLLLTLSSEYNDKNNPSDLQILTGHTISISGLSTIHPEQARKPIWVARSISKCSEFIYHGVPTQANSNG